MIDLVVFSPTCHASVLMPTRPFGHPPLPRRLTLVGCKAGRQSRGATFCSGHPRMGPNGHLNLQASLFLPFFFSFQSWCSHRSLHSPQCARRMILLILLQAIASLKSATLVILDLKMSWPEPDIHTSPCARHVWWHLPLDQRQTPATLTVVDHS